MRKISCLILFIGLSLGGELKVYCASKPKPKVAKEKTWFVDIYVQLFYEDSKLLEGYEDQNGHVHKSGKQYYAKTVIKGNEGGPVHYRFNSESVTLRTTKEGSLVFKSSTSQQLGEESKYFTDSLAAQLPKNYSSRIAKKLAP